MKVKNELPSFRDLWDEYGRTRGGFDRAYREWWDAHRAEERVIVPPWDRNEFVEIYREYESWCYAARVSFNGRPNNEKWYVTPTGGRIVVQEWIDPNLGPPAPVDPPTNELLLLSWKVHYWRQVSKAAALRFSTLKKKLAELAERGSRDPSALVELKLLHDEATVKRRTLRAIEKEREPLLPRALRPPTAEEVALNERVEKNNSAYDRSLEALEL